jgi:hypothetical protein
MTARTRTAKKTSADNTPAPANKPAAKKTPARKTTAGTTTATSRTTRTRPAKATLPPVKPTPTTPPKTTAKKAATRAAVKKTSPWPEFITHKMITAHYQAQLHGLPTRNIRDWRELPAGIAAIHFPSGARLDHTPTADAPFHANTPCPQGVIHRHPVRTIADLKDAENIAKACTDWHGAPAALALGTGLKRAKTTAADTQPIPVITKPEQPAGSDVADTQPMSADAISAHIADQLTTRAADVETAKEHPQP